MIQSWLKPALHGTYQGPLRGHAHALRPDGHARTPTHGTKTAERVAQDKRPLHSTPTDRGRHDAFTNRPTPRLPGIDGAPLRGTPLNTVCASHLNRCVPSHMIELSRFI